MGVDWRLFHHCTCKLKCNLDFYFQLGIRECLQWLEDKAQAIHLLKAA